MSACSQFQEHSARYKLVASSVNYRHISSSTASGLSGASNRKILASCTKVDINNHLTAGNSERRLFCCWLIIFSIAVCNASCVSALRACGFSLLLGERGRMRALPANLATRSLASAITFLSRIGRCYRRVLKSSPHRFTLIVS